MSVDLGTGNLLVDHRLWDVAGTGVASSGDSFYNSESGYSFDTTCANISVLSNGDVFVDGLGDTNGSLIFVKSGGGFTAPPGSGATLSFDPTAGSYTYTTNQAQLHYVFSASSLGLTSITDRNGDTVTVNGGSVTDDRGRSVSASYSTAGNTTETTWADSGLSRTWRELVPTGGVADTTIIDAAYNPTQYEYNGASQLTELTDPDGHIVTFGYDAYGRVASVTQVTNTSQLTGPTTTLSWRPLPVGTFPAGALYEVVVTNPDAAATTYVDGYGGQTLETVDALGHIHQGAYDANRDQISAMDPYGNQSTSTFSTDGYYNPLTSAAPGTSTGQTAAMADATYNVSSQAASGADPAGTSVAGYDYLASSGVSPVGNCTNDAYDAAGNITTQWTGLASTGAAGARSCNAPTGNPPSGAAIAVTTYQGDPTGTGSTTNCGAKRGEACSTTNGNKGVTTYAYDSVGETTTVTPPAPDQPTSTIYDADSRTAMVRDGAGRTATYTYDSEDRPTTIDTNAAADPTCATAADCVVGTYDADGNVTKTIDASGTTSYTYDTLGHLASQTNPGAAVNTCASPNSAAIQYSYDPAGNLTGYCDSNGTVTYAYNADNLLSGLADPGGSCAPGNVVQPCTSYSYDNDNRLQSVVWPAGTGAMECEGYDGASEVINIVAVKGACTTSPATGAVTVSTGTVLVNLHYSYATVSAGGTDTAVRQSVTDNTTGATTTYSYNTQAELTCATTTAGNCSTVGYQYVYDNDGNLTSQTVNGATTGHTYNAADQVTATPAAYNGAGDQTKTPAALAVAYNAFAQTSTLTPSGGSAVRLAYHGATQDGLSAVGATNLQDSALGVDATTGTATTAYSRTPSGGLATMRTSGGSYYYVTDANASVVALVSAAGAKAATYAYDPYGNLTNGTPTGVAANNPFRYDSGYQTPSGLYHFGARYYDPTQARWTQLDPSGQNAGYAYVGGDPINLVDTSGEAGSINCGYITCSLYFSPSSVRFLYANGYAAGAGIDALAGTVCLAIAEATFGVGGAICTAALIAYTTYFFREVKNAAAADECLKVTGLLTSALVTNISPVSRSDQYCPEP